MDPNKSPSAPPQGFVGEKSSMGQAPPPPYYDNPGSVYPQPGPAYPAQQQGYVHPTQYPGPGYVQQGYPAGQQYPGQQYPGQQYPGQQYPGQPAIVSVQPTVLTRAPLQNPVNDYLGYSIFTMLCCCLPFGIAALVYSIFTREANRAGDQAEAERNSRLAKTLNHVALGIGLGFIIIYIICVVVMTISH
ncbi:synapse differentiation-inducing gene protein 1-like [Betta splendens]|uniref:Synapse differentiation-inducing gene protein 1-like n=1 Tax=Betta splendens TaxID=158456 RepID=A0A6P7KQ82_BETSP|nr:synapse differentiation-inducing gene protein 1-like [Betta splendens]